MARITITDLQPADSEIFIYNLKDMDTQSIFGGEYNALSPAFDFGIKYLQFMLYIYAIDSISFLARSFNTTK